MDFILFALGIVVFCISLLFFIGVLFALPNFLRFRNLEVTSINGLRQGYYAVEGTVMPMEVMRAPVSNRFCVYCNYLLQWYKGGKGAHWVTEVNMTRYKKFLVTDDTGGVMVDPAKAVLDVPFTIAATRVKGRFKDMLKAHRVKTVNWLGFQRSMRCMERKLRPEDKLTIIGTVTKDTTVPTPTGLVIGKGGSSKRFMISSKPFHQLKSSAKNIYWGLLIAGVVSIVISLIMLSVGSVI